RARRVRDTTSSSIKSSVLSVSVSREEEKSANRAGSLSMLVLLILVAVLGRRGWLNRDHCLFLSHAKKAKMGRVLPQLFHSTGSRQQYQRANIKKLCGEPPKNKTAFCSGKTISRKDRFYW